MKSSPARIRGETDMANEVQRHYGSASGLADLIAAKFRASGKDLAQLTTSDLTSVDQFHIRGRTATLELAKQMELGPQSLVLDIGSGLGGPARTLAETYGCKVTGVDLTLEFCEAATMMSRWVGLADTVSFAQGDATALPFDAGTFDAAMTIHTAMNIAAKDALYSGVHRVLKPGRILAVYDILQGEGGNVLFPVPWARDPSISHLATPAEMRQLLEGASFRILNEIDSTEEGLAWFRGEAERVGSADQSPIRLRSFLGDDHRQMALNQVRNLAERRIRSVTYICRS
jgi:ubiquinone/menaquinone biosynthesis C-methylase UbiE